MKTFEGFARGGYVKGDDSKIAAILYKGEVFIPRKTFEAHEASLLKLTELHDFTIRIIDDVPCECKWMCLGAERGETCRRI